MKTHAQLHAKAHNEAVKACEVFRMNPNCVTRYAALKACNKLNPSMRVGLKQLHQL